MSSRDLAVSATLVLGSEECVTVLGSSVSTGDLNSGPFIQSSIFLATNINSIHLKTTQCVLGQGGGEVWENGSAVKSVCCCCRGSEFGSQHLHLAFTNCP